MICPNCGAQLPDTAKMCFCCKTTFQIEQKAESKKLSKKENNLDKSNKKLYIVLVAAIIAMVGLSITYKVEKGEWRLPFQKQQINYVDYDIFDYRYSVSDEWKGDGRLNTNGATFFYFKNGQYMISRSAVGGVLTEAAQDATLKGMETSGEPWSKEEIFYLDGRRAFYTSGYFTSDDGRRYKSRALITEYNGYLYHFNFAMEEKYFNSELAEEVLKHVKLPCLESYTLGEVGYAVPSAWKEDKQYEKGLRFKGDDYEFIANKSEILFKIEDEKGPENQKIYYSAILDGVLMTDDPVKVDGYPMLLVHGICDDNPLLVYVVIYQVNGYEYTFRIRFNGTEGNTSKEINSIINSIHLEKEK